jgi:spore cortex formation protein SpoVR/YcgB (stage V sporulation)
MPIVKQPSKLITASGHKSFLKRNCSFQIIIEENKASEIAKIMRLDEKTIGTHKLRLLQKTGAKTIIGLYLFNEKYKLVSLKQPA